ncbi:MAG: hypothetical protein H6733_14565 [Alphaproteobacteria bacterium]|nr:hypothetical protein [Alphaproteobacteria bacterium]
MTTVLGHDPVDVAHRWAMAAARLADGETPPRPDGTPLAELARSPAAARVSALATEAGLFSFHFEHRLHLPLAPSWVPPSQPELAEPPTWHQGVLPEAKYQSFRHDLPVASFHPHHRGKWSTHELCHGLVGFGWAPDATPFFHATAGRLAELLPVALWYFFDEAFAVRCPEHRGQGALFRTFCPACERVAAATPTDADAVSRIEAGLRFVEQELDAVARSRRAGRPLSHRWTSIDLCSDGVAYARAHAVRLDAAAFHAYVDAVAVAGGGWSADLDALQDRVLDVLGGMMGGATTPLAPSPAHGRWRWALQDVAWRLLEVATGDAEALDAATQTLLADLGGAVDATTRADGDPAAVATAAVAALVRDAGAAGLDVQAVLATGYPLPHVAPSPATVREGLVSSVPLCLDLLDASADDAIAAFVVQDGLTRSPLASRWAAWLHRTAPGVLADLAAWEAAVATLPDHAPADLPGPGADDRLRLGDTVRLVHAAHDVLALAERVDQGGLTATWTPAGVAVHDHDGQGLEPCPTALVVARDADAEVLVLDVDPQTAAVLAALGDGGVPDLPDDEREPLVDFGVLVPVALAERC